MKKVRKVVTILLVFTLGIVVGYALTIYSLFPTCYEHIFAEAPIDMPYGKSPIATSAHLSLIHDMSLLRDQSWYYVLSACDAQGKEVRSIKFDHKMAGELSDFNTSGNLKWDEDAKAVTACINDFVYTLRID